MARPYLSTALSLLCPLALALAGTAHAQELLAHDGMDYGVSGTTPVPMQGKNGGIGWLSPWRGGPVPFTGPGSWWTLDGSAADLGPQAANGMTVGATYTASVPGVLSWSTQSLVLSSVNQAYVDLSMHVGKYANLTRGTVSVWVNTTDNTQKMAILSASDSTDPDRYFNLGIDLGIPFLDIRGDLVTRQARLDATSSVADGSWHHIAITAHGNGDTDIWVDGVKEGTSWEGFFASVENLNSMSIGRSVNSNGGLMYYSGMIDDIGIWGSPLTPQDLNTLRTGGSPPLAVTGPGLPAGTFLKSDTLAGTNFPCAAYETRGFAATGNRFSDNSGDPAWRRVAANVDVSADATYYMSCLIRRDDHGGPTTECHLEFADWRLVGGIFGWTETGAWGVGMTDMKKSSVIMQDQTTYFAVLRIDAVSTLPSGGFPYDTAYLKVYGPGDTIAASDAAFTGEGGGATQWTVRRNQRGGSTGDTLWIIQSTPGGSTIEVDEIRIGRTWESVVGERYGQGCSGAQIGITGRVSIPGQFSIDLSGAPANRSAALLLGSSKVTWGGLTLPFDLTPFGAPGCSLLAAPDAVIPSSTGAAGTASIPVTVPNNPWFLNVALYGQWLAVDPMSGNPLPVVLSDGTEIRFEP